MKKSVLTIFVSRLSVILCFLLIPWPDAITKAQGIYFEHGLSWKEVQDKARKEHKYIFMDCVASTCGPCVYMWKNIFPQQEAGNFFNDRFISVKVQMDKTNNDTEEMKQWYEDAASLMKQYNVVGFPTFLFFSPEGKAIHRAGGGVADLSSFLAMCKPALDTSRQYYRLIERYNEDPEHADPDLARTIANTAIAGIDVENFIKFRNIYLLSQKGIYSKEKIEFIYNYVSTSQDDEFSTFLQHGDKVDAVMGKGASEKKIADVFWNEEVQSKLPVDKSEQPDWTTIKNVLVKKYPKRAVTLLATLKDRYLKFKEEK